MTRYPGRLFWMLFLPAVVRLLIMNGNLPRQVIVWQFVCVIRRNKKAHFIERFISIVTLTNRFCNLNLSGSTFNMFFCVYENKQEIVNGGVLPDGWTVETYIKCGMIK